MRLSAAFRVWRGEDGLAKAGLVFCEGRTLKKTSLALIAILAYGWALPAKASSYWSPSAGSITLQLVTGALLALLVTAGQYCSQLRSLFRRRPGSGPDGQDS